MHFLGLRHKRQRIEGAIKTKVSSYTKFLDQVTLIVGVIGPFTVLPQIYSVYSTQDAHGVSFSTWGLMFLVTLPWVFYGIAHKDKTLIISFTLWEIANLTVAIGALIYG